VADEAEVRRWATAERGCTNTGLLCGELVGMVTSGTAPERPIRHELVQGSPCTRP
jgi:hypothetical protein